MHTLGLLPVSAESDLHYEGNALVVQDETFIKAAERIEESLTLLRGFLPLILFIAAGAGYLTAHLFIQDRRQEYALFRSVGVGRVKSCLIFFYRISAAGSSRLCAWNSLCPACGVRERSSVHYCCNNSCRMLYFGDAGGACFHEQAQCDADPDTERLR